ncbi:MAG: serine/threonine-protein kinase [Pirellulales bacterium]
MSTPEMPSVASGDEDRLWGELAERIDAFLSAWAERPEPPALDDYLDELPRPWRRMMLGELAKVDMEQRLHTAAASWRVEDYVERWPELAKAGGPPADLIYEEYLIRRRLGEDVPPEEYFDRFASQADELRRLMGLEDPVVTTSLYTAQRPDDFQPGQRIDEFELLTVLGKGAFASVFLARQTSLERLVAIKISADRGAEPKTLAQLDHPNIVRVYDQRVLQGRKLRMLYMQYVAGGTLEHVIERTRDLPAAERNGRSFLAAVDRALDARGESPPAESSVRETLAEADWSEVVCRVGIGLAAALDYANRRGVLHRDLKPANVMLSAEGTSKLVDFNISCCSGVEGASPAAYFGGSLAYMSPEQLEACNVRHERTPDDLDARSDIYALGVVLWELLTGERPFGRETLADDWVATLEQMTGRRRLGIGPSALARIPADCPVELRDVLLTCLEPEAARRFTSAGQLERQLRRCLDREATSLLAAPTSRFKRLLAGWPLAALVAAIFVPNLVAAVFNERYNTELIPPLRTVEAEFWIVKAAINGIGFPLGIAILVWRAWPVRRALGNLTRRSSGRRTRRPGCAPLPGPGTLGRRGLDDRMVRRRIHLPLCHGRPWCRHGRRRLRTLHLFAVALRTRGRQLSVLARHGALGRSFLSPAAGPRGHHARRVADDGAPAAGQLDLPRVGRRCAAVGDDAAARVRLCRNDDRPHRPRDHDGGQRRRSGWLSAAAAHRPQPARKSRRPAAPGRHRRPLRTAQVVSGTSLGNVGDSPRPVANR